MSYEVVSSKPIESGYQVELVDEEGRSARHNSHHTTAGAAEDDAVQIHNAAEE
jgi:hypothetical protein